MHRSQGRKRKVLAVAICLGLLSGGMQAYAADLPNYFDWRLTTPTNRNSTATDAVVGEIRNQNPYGTCWSFGAIAGLESSINLQRQAVGLRPVDRLSERYLAWLTFAKPLDGSGDGFYYGNSDPGKTFDIYNIGSIGYEAITTLVRLGVAYNKDCPYVTDYHDETMAGVQSLSGNGVALHDCYALQFAERNVEGTEYKVTNNLNNNIAYYKTMLQKYGVLTVSYAVVGATTAERAKKDICTTTYQASNHAVSLVGWDDNYTMTGDDGKIHTGAWLMRNSWGLEKNGTLAGDKGYFYLSYDDATTTAANFYNAETDWGRYTAVNTAAPGAWNTTLNTQDSTFNALTGKGGYRTAHKLTSGASQFLKAVGLFVPADNMSYKVEVSLKGDTPSATQTIYTQSGTFGQDGTAMYKGYRTVDFTKYVYLPEGKNYFVTVTLTGAAGQTYNIPLSYDQGKNLTAGTSFIYDKDSGTWKDVQVPDASELGLPLYALNKYSKEANGGDFTVVSLNDNGVGGSGIYLGKKDELYTTDLLHPDRKTLSNLTVELTKGLTDSVYGGEISGEGSVTKTGTGILALSGANTYSGTTSVKEGGLALTGSLQSPVTVASGATFTGNGTINGNLTNSGTLVPGLTADASNLLNTAAGSTVTTTVPQVGTLTINGNFTSNGKLVVAANGMESSKLAVRGSSTLTGTALSLVAGGTNPLVNHQYNYLTSQGGITGNVTAEDVSPYVALAATVDGNNAYVTANQKQTLGGLSGMTPSEQSVGAALNKLTLQNVAQAPTATKTQALNGLLYQDEAASRKFTKQVTSEARAQLLNQSPMSSLTDDAVGSRLDTVDVDGLVGINANAASLDGEAPQVKTTLPVSLDANNNVWFKLFRGFETYNGTGDNYDLHNKSFGGAIGYDHAVSMTTRIGGLFSYGKTDYSTDNLTGKSHDWRVGFYGDHKNGNWEYQGLLSYGQNHYDLDRYTAYDGSTLNSDYKAKVWDVEAKAKYLIPSTARKVWQLKPYGKLSYTHTSQDDYKETGTSLLGQNQSMDSATNNSWRGEVGMEFKRNITKRSGWSGSVGYKRVISGANPELNGSFSDGNSFTLSTDNDKNYLTYSLSAHGPLGGRWTGQAEFKGEKSQNNHKEIYSVIAKYAF